MMKKALISGVLVWMTGATAVQADGLTHDCKMNDYGRGWIAPRMIIGLKENQDKAFVYDGLIAEIYESPIAAKVTRRDDKSVKLSWVVENTPVSNINSKETARYKATVFTKAQRVNVSVELASFDNRPRGDGKCTVRRRK